MSKIYQTTFFYFIVTIFTITILSLTAIAQDYTKESKEQKDQRMKWWREARFGLFIHWGLYAIPAGKWGDKTHYGEWIRHEAQIPLPEYEKLLTQFNPVKFNAKEWVKMAKNAGMKYIVITSKHHDGFCLFDSKVTDWDVMSTPFKRDILKELSDACKEEGIKMCFYYSIMDWHHPDYLPRREWEKEQRPEGDANYDRYVEYMKAQLKELVNNYGPLGILWFDGEWENTWTFERGVDMYNYVRSLQPDIIINNRVDGSRSGMAGLSEGKSVGDYGTPEQEVPAKGLPGVDWETCMTMNKHWGYNEYDKFFKTTKTLVQLLVDIVSKGGNFLLNVGPMANGEFPPESVERLKEIGEWMKVNSESIYGTVASPFDKPSWGRYTQKKAENGNTILYAHVFQYEPKSKIKIPTDKKPLKVWLLKNPSETVKTTNKKGNLIVHLPQIEPDPNDTVIGLEFEGNL
ncbi:MAG TPA: alpha-L-fucosidase [Candidatus Hydrogenedens sp.]|nr:alpha-L-fucosidase [Candidatus Hydrogenedens sp.]HPP59130.1 alpha-L-fucosidase [Candidatus Hydrogenedens sp.]